MYFHFLVMWSAGFFCVCCEKVTRNSFYFHFLYIYLFICRKRFILVRLGLVRSLCLENWAGGGNSEHNLALTANLLVGFGEIWENHRTLRKPTWKRKNVWTCEPPHRLQPELRSELGSWRWWHVPVLQYAISSTVGNVWKLSPICHDVDFPSCR